MGGKSKSSSSSKSTTIQSDERIAATDDARVQTFRIEGSNNQLTDYDAIDKAGALSLEAINSTAEIAMQALKQNQGAIDSLRDGSEKFLNYVSEAEKDESERTIQKLAPYLLLGGVSAYAISKGMK